MTGHLYTGYTRLSGKSPTT